MTTNTKRPRRTLDCGLVIFGWLAVCAVAAHFPVALRTLFVVGFVATGPGLAARRFLPMGDWIETLVIAVALSLSLGVLVTEGLALAHLETSLVALVILSTLTTGLALWPRAHRIVGLHFMHRRGLGVQR